MKTKLRIALNSLALIAVAFLGTAVSAKADSIYDITLSATTSGTIGGTGVLDIVGAAPTTGVVTITNTTADTLTFTLNGHTFTMQEATGKTASADFSSGVLESLTYSAVVGDLSLAVTPTGYTYTDTGTHPATGVGTYTSAVVPTPEPSSTLLLGLGLFSLGLLAVFKRKVAVTA